MRKLFLVIVAVAGAWGGAHLALNLGAEFHPMGVPGAVSPAAGLLIAPGVVFGALLGLLVASLAIPRRY